MNEIWHDIGEPNYNTPVVVIDRNGRIVYFGYYGPRLIENDERWAYMIELVNNTCGKETSTATSSNIEKYIDLTHKLSFENMGKACREYLEKEGHPCDKCNCNIKNTEYHG